jgi:hypothetical protein
LQALFNCAFICIFRHSLICPENVIEGILEKMPQNKIRGIPRNCLKLKSKALQKSALKQK